MDDPRGSGGALRQRGRLPALGPGPAGEPRGTAFGHAEVFAALAAVSFLVARFLPVLAVPYECPLRALTGIPCATCGMTHAFVYLAHAEAARAWHASPFGAALAAGTWLFAGYDALRLALHLPLPRPGPRLARVLASVGILALLMNWAFLVVTRR
jgi:hypothetical protein